MSGCDFYESALSLLSPTAWTPIQEGVPILGSQNLQSDADAQTLITNQSHILSEVSYTFLGRENPLYRSILSLQDSSWFSEFDVTHESPTKFGEGERVSF